MTRTRKLRWGILSTAHISRKVIPPLKRSQRNELHAVASRVETRAVEFARTWDIPQAYGSYEALLSDPDIDVIYNPLPNSLHAEWTIKALQAGKHVLCEKPLAISLEEVDAMAKAAQESGKILAEAFMYRHHPQTLKVKELINEQAVGKVRLIRGSFTFNMLDRPADIRLDADLGGGCLWDVGCYPVSYTRFMLGAEPEEVFGWREDSSDGVDIHFVGQMRFPESTFAQFDNSFSTAFRTQIEVVGTLGTITIPHPFTPGRKETLLLLRQDETQKISIHSDELYSGEVEDIADAILTHKPPRISLSDSRSNTAALLALYQSSRMGKPILLQSKRE
jgi:D-xylose 1-dehydrogenase (NADP+, D-xylono-1,5-lactone-forming)